MDRTDGAARTGRVETAAGGAKADGWFKGRSPAWSYVECGGTARARGGRAEARRDLLWTGVSGRRRSAGALRTAQGPREHELGELRDPGGVERGRGNQDGGRRSGAALGKEVNRARVGAVCVRRAGAVLLIPVVVSVAGRVEDAVGDRVVVCLFQANQLMHRGRHGGQSEQQHAGREQGGESWLEAAEAWHDGVRLAG